MAALPPVLPLWTFVLHSCIPWLITTGFCPDYGLKLFNCLLAFAPVQFLRYVALSGLHFTLCLAAAFPELGLTFVP